MCVCVNDLSGDESHSGDVCSEGERILIPADAQRRRCIISRAAPRARTNTLNGAAQGHAAQKKNQNAQSPFFLYAKAAP